MKRIILILAALSLVASCGGRAKPRYSAPSVAPVLFATGPISSACLRANRPSASRARCGCIQAVADTSLSASDQKRGAGYFSDPAKLQEVRQSDSWANERFWKAWSAFGEEAAAICAAT